MKIKEIQKVINYQAGYQVRWELVDGKEFGCDDIVMKSAYTPDGHYIGNPKDAYRLCKKRGIKPELRTDHSRFCSIGFCEAEQKWYGWSHRAIYGFGVGDGVARGDCAYVPTDWEDAKHDAMDFHGGIRVEETIDDDGKPCFDVITGGMLSVQAYPPDAYGKGEWTARTLADAKQMACDFAEGVG